MYWSDSGDVVTVACDTSFFILKLNTQLLATAPEAGEDGIEESFELLHEVNEKYVNSSPIQLVCTTTYFYQQYIYIIYIYISVSHHCTYIPNII